MRILFKTVLFAAILMALVPPAHADSVSFSFGSGSGHRYKHGHGYGHGHGHHYAPPRHYGYYAPPRPIVWRRGFTTYTHYPQYVYVPVIVKADAREEPGYCREYQAAATVGGKKQPSYGKACLQPDGSWKIVD